jgi:putative ATP-dependent endonuclease of OLD family
VADLIAMEPDEKINVPKDRCVAFQTDVLTIDGEAQMAMIPRTLEEAIAYENFALLRTGTLSIGILVPVPLEEAYGEIYKRIGSKDFKKTDFAMSLLAAPANWVVPVYIATGLRWLESRLCPVLENSSGHDPEGEVAAAAPAGMQV